MRDYLNPFAIIFGDKPEINVLDFLVSSPYDDFTRKDLEVKLNVSHKKVSGILENYLTHSIIREKERIGRCILYEVNLDEGIVRLLIDLREEIMRTVENKLIEDS